MQHEKQVFDIFLRCFEMSAIAFFMQQMNKFVLELRLIEIIN